MRTFWIRRRIADCAITRRRNIVYTFRIRRMSMCFMRPITYPAYGRRRMSAGIMRITAYQTNRRRRRRRRFRIRVDRVFQRIGIVQWTIPDRYISVGFCYLLRRQIRRMPVQRAKSYTFCFRTHRRREHPGFYTYLRTVCQRIRSCTDQEIVGDPAYRAFFNIGRHRSFRKEDRFHPFANASHHLRIQSGCGGRTL